MLRRLANQVPRNKLKNLADSLWMSKLRYGLQLCAKVRMNEEETTNQYVKATQIAQNKMLRLLEYSKISNRRRIKDMLEKHDLLSVNQTSAL